MTMKWKVAYALLATVISVTLGGLFPRPTVAASETTLSALAKETHFHGIAVDPADDSQIYLATHHGFYVLTHDGSARRVSETGDDFMGFTPHPTDPMILYGSGHPAGGGNLGFIVSKDGGASWTKLADGVGGPVDFHQMTVSKADPNVIYGVFGNLQKSIDGGRSWRQVGPAPEGLISLAGSSRDANTLYAATQSGLLTSGDGGKRWAPAHTLRRPATAVHVTLRGDVLAFVVGLGLVRTVEPALNWQNVSNDFGDGIVLHIASHPDDTQRFYVIVMDPETRTQSVHASDNGGLSWVPLGAE